MTGNQVTGLQLYRKRWLILAIFCSYSLTNDLQWLQYSIIAGPSTAFYDIDLEQLNWFSVIYELVYIPLILPATYGMEKHGIMHAAVIGSSLSALGACIKLVAAGTPTMVGIAYVGQVFGALGQVWILGIPPLLAAKWFGAYEVSRATSIGVAANQIGIAFGMAFPPLVVPEAYNHNFTFIGRGLSFFLYAVAGCAVLEFILVVLVYEERPPTPPSVAQASVESHEVPDYTKVVAVLVKDRDFVLLFFEYGILVGAFYSFSTLLTPVLSVYFPGRTADFGVIGLLYVISGIVGSVAAGYFLDWKHKYKLCAMTAYLFSLVFMIIFTFILQLQVLWSVYVVSMVLGFFTTAYLPVGFEYAVELTYPVNEGVTAGLLNMSAQAFGIALTMTCTALLKQYGPTAANLLVCAVVLVGLLLTAITRERLQRWEVETQAGLPGARDEHQPLLDSSES